MTTTNAWVAFEDNVKGSITPGKLADLTILSEDPLTIDPFDVRDITIDMTIMDGVVRHDGIFAGSNIALNKTVTASNSLLDNPPDFAVDGDLETNWGAGVHPPEWIEVDLGGTFTVNRINLVVDQFPDGPTRHQLFGKVRAQDSYELLHEFDGATSTGQNLEYVMPTPWSGRFIKVETLASPSWVSWKEIEVFSVVTTGISSPSSPEIKTVPGDLTLSQNYPNPFKPSGVGTTITYRLARRTHVRLTVFDALGKAIQTLVQEEREAGPHSVIWDGRDEMGRPVASGLYFYRLQAGGFQKVARMLFVR